jgi:hypothetical protein
MTSFPLLVLIYVLPGAYECDSAELECKEALGRPTSTSSFRICAIRHALYKARVVNVHVCLTKSASITLAAQFHRYGRPLYPCIRDSIYFRVEQGSCPLICPVVVVHIIHACS